MLIINNIDNIKAEKCRRSFFYFIQEFWSEADTSVMVYNWHIEYIANELQIDVERVLNGEPKINDIILNIAPGTSKSMIVSVLLPAWCFIKKPTTRIISASYSNTISLELSIKTRNLLKTDKFKRFFPYVELKTDEDAKGLYKTKNNGFRFVTSTGSNILGLHSDIIICDDIQNLDSVYSEALRNGINNWVTGTLSTRKVDKLNSIMIFVQQRLHPLDFTSYLLSLNVPIKHIILPAEINDSIKPIELKEKYINGLLDTKRLNREALKNSKIYLGTKNYNAQFLQSPDDETDSIIKMEWIEIVDHFFSDEKFYFLDTAYGEKNSDNSVILECFTKDNNIYISNLKVVNEKFPDLLKTINLFCKGGKKVYIEGKANGKSIIQSLRNETKYNIIEINPNGSKLERLVGISPIVEGRRVKLFNAFWNEQLLNEVCINNPKNDDIRDCFIYAVNELLVKGIHYAKYHII